MRRTNVEGGSQSTREYKVWTKLEEKTLITCMMELMEKTFVEKGNFRASGLKELEKMMHARLVDCQLLAVPHIKSKIRYFKDKFMALLQLKEASGFGWDEVRGCVVADDNVFNDWLQTHPKASGLNNKPLPFFDELCIIFGKDQALGVDAVQPSDAASKLDPQANLSEAMGEKNDHFDSYTIPDNMDHNAVMEEIINQGIDLHATSLKEVESEFTSKRTQLKGKEKATSFETKRSRQQFLEDERTQLTTNLAMTSENIAKIATNYCIEGELAVKRQFLYQELAKFSELSISDRTKALWHLNRDDGDASNFFQLPTDEEKLEFVYAILE